MRIAISGKGGTGKTTLAGTLSRWWGRHGRSVLALDADSNPNLAHALGVPRNGAPLTALPPTLGEWRTDADDHAYVHLTRPLNEVQAEFGIAAPDNVTLLVMGEVDHAGVGCRCSAHANARGIMGQLFQTDAPIVIADMEAGLEHLGRGTVEHADALLIVIEPYYRALEAGQRIQGLAEELGVPRIYAVANKIRDAADESAVRQYAANHGLTLVGALPYDDGALAAERAATTLFDAEPDGPYVQAVGRLAAELEARLGAPERQPQS